MFHGSEKNAVLECRARWSWRLWPGTSVAEGWCYTLGQVAKSVRTMWWLSVHVTIGNVDIVTMADIDRTSRGIYIAVVWSMYSYRVWLHWT